MTTPTPQCFFCWHRKKTSGAVTCPAFPEGVPDLILLNSIPHDRPMLGQDGDLVYKPLPQHAMDYPTANDHFEPAVDASDEEPADEENPAADDEAVRSGPEPDEDEEGDAQ